jgi:hypothetical protein
MDCTHSISSPESLRFLLRRTHGPSRSRACGPGFSSLISLSDDGQTLYVNVGVGKGALRRLRRPLGAEHQVEPGSDSISAPFRAHHKKGVPSFGTPFLQDSLLPTARSRTLHRVARPYPRQGLISSSWKRSARTELRSESQTHYSG